MREIKFRAWHKQDKKMYSASVGDTPKIMLHDKGGSFSEWSIEPREYLEIMQYTGLKDKNGKEIYEGDILKSINGGYITIKFGDWSCFCCDHVYGYGGLFTKETDRHYEIIGNIYEHSDLLKNETN